MVPQKYLNFELEELGSKLEVDGWIDVVENLMGSINRIRNLWSRNWFILELFRIYRGTTSTSGLIR